MSPDSHMKICHGTIACIGKGIGNGWRTDYKFHGFQFEIIDHRRGSCSHAGGTKQKII